MENLKELNLVELNAQEKKETEGGIVPIILVGMFLLGVYNGCEGVRRSA
jgi:hypothetical protein